MSIRSFIRELIEVLKEILLAIFVHKAMDKDENFSTPVSTGVKPTAEDPKKKADPKGKGTEMSTPAKTEAKESFWAAVGRWAQAFLSNDERNAFITLMMRVKDKGITNALLDLEQEMLKNKNPLAENTFAKVIAGIAGDMKAQFPEPAQFDEVFTAFIGLVKDDPTRFRALLELSNNNVVEQHLKAGKKYFRKLARRMSMSYGAPGWVRREPTEGEGTVLSNFVETILSGLGNWNKVLRNTKGWLLAALLGSLLALGVVVYYFVNEAVAVIGIGIPLVAIISSFFASRRKRTLRRRRVVRRKPSSTVTGFLGTIVRDLWTTVNWYARRFLILIAGLLLVSVFLFVIGAYWALIIVSFFTVGTAIHLAFIRFRYPLVLVGIASTDEGKKVIGHLTFALVGVCTVSLVLAALGILISGGHFSAFDGRMLIGVTVLMWAMTFIVPAGRRSGIQVVLLVLTFFSLFLAIFPRTVEKIPGRLAKTDEVWASKVDSAAKEAEPTPFIIPVSYNPYASPAIPPTLRAGYTPKPRPVGEPREERLALVGKDTVASKILMSQEMNTALQIKFNGGPGVVMGMEQGPDGRSRWFGKEKPANVAFNWVANDGLTVVEDHFTRFARVPADSGKKDSMWVVVELVLF